MLILFMPGALSYSLTETCLHAAETCKAPSEKWCCPQSRVPIMQQKKVSHSSEG